MAEQPDNNRKKQLPAPVLAAQRVLAMLEQENQELAATIARILPAFAMTLERRGEETDDDVLLDHARKGVAHLKSWQENRQQELNYADIRRNLKTAAATGAYPEEPDRRLWEAVRRNDLREIKKCLNLFFDDKYEDMVKTAFRVACECGHLRLVRYFYEKEMVDKGDCQSALRESCADGRVNVVKYLVEKVGVDVHLYNDSAMNTAATYGRLNVAKYLFRKHHINVKGNATFLHAAAQKGHLDVVKFLVKECGADVPNNNENALRAAATAGHLGVVKFLIEQGGANPAGGSRNAVYNAVESGNLDLVRYFINDLKIDVHQDDDALIYAAARWNQPHIMRYFADEHGLKFKEVDPKQHTPFQKEMMGRNARLGVQLIDDYGLSETYLGPEELKKYKKLSKLRKKWHRAVHIDPPVGCEEKMPYHFHRATFETVAQGLKDDGYAEPRACNLMAYQTSALFGTEQRFLQYLAKWGTKPFNPVHDLVYAIKIPSRGVKDFKLWGDAVLKCGPSMAKLVTFADKIPVPEKSADGLSWSMVRTREKVAQFVYKNASGNPDLARLCVEHALPEEDFNKTLKVVKQRADKKNLPEITIDGADFGMPEAQFYRLSPEDPRAAIMGHLVDCCQSVGGHGHDCAVHSVTSEDGGIYVVETKKSQLVLGEAWAWRGQKGEMCFDTLETLGQAVRHDQWKKLLQAVARELTTKKDHDVTQLTVGIGGDTPETLSTVFATISGTEAAKPRGDYDKKRKYRESHRQLVVWTKK